MPIVHNKIPYTQAQKTAVAVCTAAKTTYSDIANAILLLTAGADGAVVTALSAIPRATVTATQLQLYLSRDNGTTVILLRTKLMAAYTMAQTTEAPVTDFGWTPAEPLRLGPADRLYVAAGVALAGGIAFTAQFQDY